MRFGLLASMLALSACARPNAAFDPDGAGSVTTGQTMPTSTTVTTDVPVTSETGTSAGTGSPQTDTGFGSTSSPPPTDVGEDSETGETIECPVFSGDCTLDAPRCPRGSSCRPYSDGADAGVACIKDVPIDQSLRVGDVCTHRCDLVYGVDDCPQGSICDPFAPEDPTCVERCVGVEDCTDGLCVGASDIGLCRPAPSPCDPLAQDCPGEYACYFGETDCLPEGKAPFGAKCSFVNQCQQGGVCASSAEANCPVVPGSCCAELCNPMNDTCGAGQFCQDYADGYGICVSV